MTVEPVASDHARQFIIACDIGNKRYFEWGKWTYPNGDLVSIHTIQRDLSHFLD